MTIRSCSAHIWAHYLAHRRPASMMRRRKRRVRSSDGSLNNRAGGACSTICPSARKHTRLAPVPDWVDVPSGRFLRDQCAIAPVAGDNHAVAREARMALMFLNGDGMRGGRAHYTIEGVPLVGERRTASRYRFF